MGLYNFVARNILAPVVDFSRGSHTIRCLKSLEESQWWPREKILELQNRRLRELIKYSFDNVTYYRGLMLERGLKPESIQSSVDLEKLPVLTKSLIKDNFNEITAANYPEDKRILLSTGGSTGETLKFYRGKEDQLSWGFAASQRAYGWGGYRLGDKIVKVGVIRPYRSRKHQLSETIKREMEKVLYFDAKTFSETNLVNYVNLIRKYKPLYIVGYPSSIEMLARHIKKENKIKYHFKAIFSGGEQVYDYQRELFSEIFNCKTYSNYASWEAHAIAAECGEGKGYHINAENFIIEITDENGKVLPHGQEGQVLITNLHNYAMPFIRYKIGDLAVSSDAVCTCGRGLPLLSALNGRISDVIYTPDGRTIPAIALANSSLVFLGVNEFQYVQDSIGILYIKLVMDQPYTKEHLDDLIVLLTKKYKGSLGENMDIRIEFVDEIPKTESGKRKIAVSNIKR